MSDLKTWVAVESNLVVHGPFQAPQEYIDSYTEQVVDRTDRVTPEWYNEHVIFVDVTALDPSPVTGWFKATNGAWVDGNPTLLASRNTIPADGVTTALITFMQKGPKVPIKVKFNVNGQEIEENVVNGQASIEVTSINGGDVIEVKVRNQIVVITVEG